MLTTTSSRTIRLVEDFHELTRLYKSTVWAFHQSVVNVNSSEAVLNIYTKEMYKKYVGRKKIQLAQASFSDEEFGSVLENRKSTRVFDICDLSITNLSNILDGSLGHKIPFKRPYPSAGGIYAVEHYIVILNSAEIPPGVYHYEPKSRTLSLLGNLDVLEFTQACDLTDDQIENVMFIVVQTIVFRRHVSKYNGRGYRFSMIEVGLAAQTLTLNAAARGIGSCMWGGGYDDELERILGIDTSDEVIANTILFGKAEQSQ